MVLQSVYKERVMILVANSEDYSQARNRLPWSRRCKYDRYRYYEPKFTAPEADVFCVISHQIRDMMELEEEKARFMLKLEWHKCDLAAQWEEFQKLDLDLAALLKCGGKEIDAHKIRRACSELIRELPIGNLKSVEKSGWEPPPHEDLKRISASMLEITNLCRSECVVALVKATEAIWAKQDLGEVASILPEVRTVAHQMYEKGVSLAGLIQDARSAQLVADIANAG
ncbi:hypothetical protein BKA67DRAFT_553805 [Truncatella angustata]|uniref:Uncharacterized protein n=1 Tax=Truncatella angustata TaxID=152316 RepID=A0A9P8URK0_9PEZI|nr:uncharacterized protein BKA67DRAFT_553805 [Truncatella angustata]KAH6656948.1 hypothetical protein BKA67DRAFT_553805 [Truncatella angustata]